MCLIQRTGHETTEKKRDAFRIYQLQCHFFGCQPADCINNKKALADIEGAFSVIYGTLEYYRPHNENS